MAEVDSLEIKIGADAAKASQAIDKLVKNIDSLANSLKSINTSAMSTAAKSLSQNLSNINGKGFSELNKSAKKAQKTVNQISTTAKKGIKSKISFDTSEYQKAIDVFGKKFSEAGKSFKPEGNLTGLEKQADKLSSKLENLLQKEDKIVSIGKTSPESSVFQNLQYDISETVNKIDIISSKIGELKTKAKDLSNIKINRWDEQTEKSTPIMPKTIKIPASSIGYDKETMDTIEKIASGADKAKEKTDSLGNKVDELKEKLKELKAQGLSFGDAKFDETYKQLNKANDDLKKYKNNLDQAGGSGGTFADRMRNALSDVNSSSSRTGNAMRSLSNSVKKAFNAMKSSSVSTAGLARNLGLLYAKIHIITRLGRSLFESIGSAQDYIEEFNYFSVALDKIGKDSASQFKEAGYNSAEEYAKSFRGRFAKLQKQMTGYEVDYDTGDAVSKMTHNLGLDLTEIMNFNAGIAQITNSAGMLGETSIMTSKALSMLSADWSSLANEDLSTTMEHLRSGLIGQSRAVYRYGIDITNAGLAQTAMNHGLDVSINKLSQQSKMQLRALTILEQSKVAYGDLAKTINQPMNQLRMLQAGFKKLSMTIGSLFIPIVQQVYPYLNALVMVLQEFVQWIAKTAGIKLGDISGGISAPDYSDMADDTDSAADNMDKVAKKTKKASDNLQGFDIINKLTKDESDKDDKDKGVKNIDLSKDLAAALKEYESIWDKAFKDNTNKAVQLAKKIKKALLDAWKTGDFSKIGAKLAEWINKGLAKIPWNKIKATIKKIAKSIATFLNGFIKGIDWTLVGKTIAEGLNTAIDGAYEFWTTFDWLTFGESLAEGVRSFVDNFNAKKYGKLLGAKLRGVIQFAFGLLTNLPYKKIGKKFGDAINGFFEDMGEVRKNTGLTGWQELGQTISKSIVGILDTISVALATVKWEEVGKAIADFLTSIDWWGILSKLIGVIAKTFTSIVKTAFYAFAENPAGVIGSLAGAFALIFTVSKMVTALSFLRNRFKNVFSSIANAGITDATVKSNTLTDGKMGNGIANAFKALGKNSKILGAISKIGEAFGKGLSFYIGLNIAMSIAESIGSALKSAGSEKSDKLGEYAAYAIGDSLEFSAGYVQDLLSGNFSEVSKKTKELGKAWKGTKAGGDAGKTTKKYENDPVINRVIKKMEEFGYSKDSTKVASIAKNLSEGLKSGKISTSDVLHATYKKYDTSTENKKVQSVADFLEKIGVSGKVKTVLKKSEKGEEFVPLITQTTKYKNSVSSLEKKMKKLGTTETETKGIENSLKNALEKGEISWGKYKKIVDGNYKSVDELKEAIKKLSPKSVKVKASTEGKKDVDELSSSVNGLPTGQQNLFYKVTTQGINDIDTLKQAMGSLSNKTISATISPKLRKDWYKLVQKELLAKTFTINAKTTTKGKGEGDKLAGFAESIKNAGIKSEIGKKINYKKLASLLSKVDTTWDKFGQVVIPGESDFEGENAKAKAKSMQMSKNWKALIEYLKKMGIRTNNPILFANGGFPEDGWFRASRDELIGQWDNGQSVVATNYQITEGIAQAVGPATYAAVKAAMNENRGGGNGTKDVLVLDKSYRQIAEGVIGEVNSMTRSKGKSPILGVN